MVQVKNDHLSLPPTSASSYVRVQASTRARGPTAHMACCLLVPLPSNHPTRMHQPTDGEMDGAVSPIHPCCSHACPVPLSSISHLHSRNQTQHHAMRAERRFSTRQDSPLSLLSSSSISGTISCASARRPDGRPATVTTAAAARRPAVPAGTQAASSSRAMYSLANYEEGHMDGWMDAGAVPNCQPNRRSRTAN